MFYIAVFSCIIVILLWYVHSDTFNLVCVVAERDGNKYCVRESDRIQESVELLAEATDRMTVMVKYMHKKYPDDARVQYLVRNYNPKRIVETLPTSQHTAYSEGKGAKLAFCLRKYKYDMQLIDINTLTFVALHELTHLMTTSVGHQTVFWENFKFLLENASDANVYNPQNYAKHPSEYCGLTIDSNPMF